ncbi:hypothetical protein Taro_022663, partial [Colocasia esculenta]|nr:hypothetical protein [Colocasia esculenta]
MLGLRMADGSFPASYQGHLREVDAAELRKETESSSTTPAASSAAPRSGNSLKRKRPLGIKIPAILGEIPLGEVGDRGGTAGQEDEGLGGASGPGWGVFSRRGRRKKAMEDAHRVAVSGPQGHPHKIFFGVYDGHGGRRAVEYVVENLHTNVFKMLEELHDVERGEAIKAGFLKTDQEFLKQGCCSGSCCVTALIEKETIIIANLGDCRAVLSRGGIAEALTNDHTASREEEQQRIQNKGGVIEDHGGTWRVQGTLAVTRSIGDINLKDWVLAEPETVVLPLASDMEFLILASDGLWDKVGNQEAVDVATQIQDEKNNIRTEIDTEADENQFGCENTSPHAKLRRMEKVKQQHKVPNCPGAEEVDFTRGPGICSLTVACRRLAGIAKMRGSLDDITVLIIDLSHFLT